MAFAAQAKTTRKIVRHIIEDFGLFEISGNRFKTTTKSEESRNKTETKSPHSHARKDMYAGEDIEIDIEKEKKEKCVRRKGTHSEFETLRAGRRYASHGQPLPADAPSQRKVAFRPMKSSFSPNGSLPLTYQKVAFRCMKSYFL
ncbi:hypothetical protein [Xylanibacter ruminicola]|uniref:hypothetical protein n=1 Tax=Xylanibacter ruminicola TaxID=839 RepID=UPI00056810B1|nr:hypothetical protein [Xylanibacter ruminicola]